MLTPDQLRTFKRTGFLVFRDALDEETCERARELVWDAIPVEPDEPETWFDRGHDEILNRTSDSDSRLSSVEPFERLFRDVYPYAEPLVGEGLLAAPDERPTEYCLHGGHLMASRDDGSVLEHDGLLGPILQYPESYDEDDPDRFSRLDTRHVDGYVGEYADGTDVTYLPFTVGIAAYLDEVEPRGGGFTVWPGSHLKVKRYFREHSYQDYIDAGGSVLDDLDLGPPFEVTGGAGTLVLWHHNIVHGAGPNHSERIRMAAFQRIARKDVAEIGEGGLGDAWLQFDAIRDLEPVVRESF